MRVNNGRGVVHSNDVVPKKQGREALGDARPRPQKPLQAPIPQLVRHLLAPPARERSKKAISHTPGPALTVTTRPTPGPGPHPGLTAAPRPARQHARRRRGPEATLVATWIVSNRTPADVPSKKERTKGSKKGDGSLSSATTCAPPPSVTRSPRPPPSPPAPSQRPRPAHLHLADLVRRGAHPGRRRPAPGPPPGRTGGSRGCAPPGAWRRGAGAGEPAAGGRQEQPGPGHGIRRPGPGGGRARGPARPVHAGGQPPGVASPGAAGAGRRGRGGGGGGAPRLPREWGDGAGAGGGGSREAQECRAGAGGPISGRAAPCVAGRGPESRPRGPAPQYFRRIVLEPYARPEARPPSTSGPTVLGLPAPESESGLTQAGTHPRPPAVLAPSAQYFRS